MNNLNFCRFESHFFDLEKKCVEKREASINHLIGKKNKNKRETLRD